MDPIALCADATARWHASWLTALGLRSERRATVWRAIDPAPPIYWAAITLAPEASAGDVADARGTLCDAWGALDLSPFGFVERARAPWFVRPAAELPPDPGPSELEVVHVSTPEDVLAFEDVSLRGFVGERFGVDPGSVHPATILRDDRMTMLIGRVAGAPVSAAMSYRTEGAVGIYGVTTIASARGRGHASALTRALIDPPMPTVLSPSPEAEGLYRRLGFASAGEFRRWERSEEGA